jgi:hypothetical protein
MLEETRLAVLKKKPPVRPPKLHTSVNNTNKPRLQREKVAAGTTVKNASGN